MAAKRDRVASNARSAAAQRVRHIVESTEGRGWLQLHRLLLQAAEDPAVQQSTPTSEFVAVLVDFVGDAISARDAGEILSALHASVSALNGARGGRPTRRSRWEEWERRVEALKSSHPSMTPEERYDDVASEYPPIKWRGVRDGISKLKRLRKEEAKGV